VVKLAGCFASRTLGLLCLAAVHQSGFLDVGLSQQEEEGNSAVTLQK
jgi:hypothetical protein